MIAVSLLAKQRELLITIMMLWIRHWGFPLASKILVIVCEYQLRHKGKFWCCTIPVDCNNTDRFFIFGMLQVMLLTWYTINVASWACHHQNDNLITKAHSFAEQSGALFHLAYQIWYIICQRTSSKLQCFFQIRLRVFSKVSKVKAEHVYPPEESATEMRMSLIDMDDPLASTWNTFRNQLEPPWKQKHRSEARYSQLIKALGKGRIGLLCLVRVSDTCK